MKLFLVLLILAGLYTFSLLKTTDLVMNQTQKLSATYNYVANNSDRIASGQAIPESIYSQP